MLGRNRIELLAAELETTMLPLHQRPIVAMYCCGCGHDSQATVLGYDGSLRQQCSKDESGSYVLLYIFIRSSKSAKYRLNATATHQNCSLLVGDTARPSPVDQAVHSD